MRVLGIYHIERVGETDYDNFNGFVVAALTASAARKLAQTEDDSHPDWDDDKHEYVPSTLWLSSKRSRCRRLGEANRNVKPGIIMWDFRAG